MFKGVIWNGCNFIKFLTAYILWPGAGRIKTGTYRNDTHYTHYRHDWYTDIHKANVSPYCWWNKSFTSWYGKYPIFTIFSRGFTHPNSGWPWDFWSINSIGYTVFCFFSILSLWVFFYLQNHSTNQLPRHGPRGDLPSGTFGVQDILRTGKVAESSISDEAGTFHRRWLSSCKTWENARILHFFKRLRNYKKKVVFLDFPLFIEELVPSRSLTVRPWKVIKTQ